MNVRTNALLLLALLAAPAEAQRAVPIVKNRLHSGFRAIGMAADAASQAAVVFDAGTDGVIGLVQLGDGAPLCYGDCVITSDLTLGYVTTVFGEIWVVDLTTSPPSLAGGINPIFVDNNALDIALSADDSFLVTVGGNTLFAQQVQVVDLATRMVVGSFTGSTWVAADVGPDGNVLVASEGGDRTRRLTLDATGQLTATSNILRENNPLNLGIAPGGTIGLLIGYFPGRVRSFTIPGLVAVQTLTPPGTDFVVNALADPGASRVYVRRETTMLAFAFDNATGGFGGDPLWSTALGDILPCYGNEQIGLHPDGSKLYTTVPGGVQVIDPATGALLTTISHSALPLPTGLCVRGVEAELEISLDVKPGGCPNSFNPKGHGILPVALVGTGDFDVTMVDVASLRLARADGTGESVAPLEGPPGPHTEAADVSTPFVGETCDCSKLAGDGILDLEAKFASDELVPALGLDVASPGALVELVLTGELLDGTSFSATDCVRLVPPDAPGSELSIAASAPRGWIQVSPPDLLLDTGGFGEFERTYPLGTRVTLLAAELEGRPFVAWEVNGVRQKLGEPTLTYQVKGGRAELRAIYDVLRLKR